MKGSIALCNEKNASFSWDDTRPKHVGRRASPSDGRHDSSSSLYDGDRRHRQHHSGFVEPLGERRTSRSRDQQVMSPGTTRNSAGQNLWQVDLRTLMMNRFQ
ncbi:hypothetical protein PoB_000362000 [Plakobranchus ocellatus]|uniref:Uncharacterized protein n=1 Tax=Plakobranchus ocellatus TaxID=259542 RepID=A0AAV3Y2L6_9GAST|nr:hypothetical protein PoB_000362000 [Plakobranchus ocellatus]